MDSISKMNIIIATISALATLAAAIIYYYTLGELRKQRENTFKPHLFIDNIYFYVQGLKKGSKMFPSKWGYNSSATGTIEEFSFENSGISEFGLKCYNIGFGTAKKITITFSYDIDAFINQVNALNEHVEPEHIITVKKEDLFISFECKNKNMPFPDKAISIDGVLSHYLSYSLPVSVKSEFSLLKLPVHFLELLNVYVFLFSSISNKKDKNIELNIPIITSEIKYFDISNKEFSKSMTISTKISMFSVAGFSGEFKIFEQ
jgi:hypothetical protein